MNCKPGDLAVLIRSAKGESTGKVCRVLGLSHLLPGHWVCEFPHPIRWRNGHTGNVGHVNDSWLRPIRPQDGEDETLTWAGKPEQITA